MSWFSDLVGGGGGGGGMNVDWNPGNSPVWANTSADPRKASFGGAGASLAGAGVGMGLGSALGTTLSPLVGIDPITGALIGSAIGTQKGAEAGQDVAGIPFESNKPATVLSTAPSNSTVSNSVAGQKGQAARALEANLRSQKRAELPKNIEQTFNLESSLNKMAGNKGV